jgi:hypothetical protein
MNRPTRSIRGPKITMAAHANVEKTIARISVWVGLLGDVGTGEA